MNQFKNNRLFFFLPYLLFFTGSFIFFGFFADYIEFYQEKLSMFVFSRDYLNNYVDQPGSLLVYLGKFLTTFYYYPIAGAAIISLIICLIIYMTSKIISSLSGREPIILPLLFGTAFFIMQTNYRYLLHNSLGVLLQLSFFFLAIRYMKGFLPVIIFPFWYWITGSFGWLFAILYTIFLVMRSIRKEWPKIISLFILSFLFVYLLQEFFIFQPPKTLMIFPFSDEQTGGQYRFFITVIPLLSLLPLVAKIYFRFPSWVKKRDFSAKFIYPLLSFLLIAVSSLLCFDKVNKEYFHSERLFYQGKFDELTEYITEHPTTNRLTVFLVNAALCERGKLNDLLFHFPQSPDGQSLFLKWEMLGEVLKRGGYFYYTTGMINEAHRWAYENMVMKGLTPEGLKTLIKTEIINGNYKVAAKYILILKKTIFYRKVAHEYEKLLFDDKAVESHPELGPKRKEKIVHDFFSITDNPYSNLERLLLSDSLNRKAFDYKMAYLMVTKNLKALAANLNKFETLGFSKIPVHLEEAALVCKISDPSTLSKLGNLKINPSTEDRFNQFLQTFQLYGNNLKSAQPTLKQKFGDTFWYYAFYH